MTQITLQVYVVSDIYQFQINIQQNSKTQIINPCHLTTKNMSGVLLH